MLLTNLFFLIVSLSPISGKEINIYDHRVENPPHRKSYRLYLLPKLLKGEKILSPIHQNLDTLFNDDGIPHCYFDFGDVYWWAQRFTPGVLCTLKKALIITYDSGGAGDFYLWRDSAGVPGQVIFGPVRLVGGSHPYWEEIEIPNITIATDFWAGLRTSFPPYPCTDRRYDYPRRVAYSRDGVNWSVAEWMPWGDLMIRAVGKLTGARHDVAVWEISPGQSPLHPVGSDVLISTVVQNLGNGREDSCPILYRVYDEGGNPITTDTTFVSLSPRQIDTAIFTRRWHPITSGEYRICVKNLLPNDVVQENNSRRIKGFVHRYPSLLRYDDGTFEGGFGLGVDSFGRFAMKFTPPYYPTKIESLKLYLADIEDSLKAIGLIIDDDGPNGEPGTILCSEEITAREDGWYAINLSPYNVIITSGSFYAGYQNPPGWDCYFRGDMTSPLTGLDWCCFDGEWYPEEGRAEWGIRVWVNFPQGINEEKGRDFSQFKVLPMAGKTKKFLIPVSGRTSLTIYNLKGKPCRKWIWEGKETKRVVWDTKDENNRDLPSGVYILFLKSQSGILRNKIVLLR